MSRQRLVVCSVVLLLLGSAPARAQVEPVLGAPPPTRDQLLALVARSPEYVESENRAAWLGLFATDGFVADPVGSPPAPLADGTMGRFWDTFIAGHQIVFEVLGDYVSGLNVFRDVIIHSQISPDLRLD